VLWYGFFSFGKDQMKNLAFYISLLLNMCLIVNMGLSTTYYVDAISGNDDNIGTSPAQAWKTINKVDAVVFQPGDSILFHRGQSWTGKISINYSGNWGQPVVFSSYGQGGYPIIKGSTDADSTFFWIYIENGMWESSLAFNNEISVLFYNTNDSLPLRAKKESSLTFVDEVWDFYYDPVTHKISIFSPDGNPANIADGIQIVHFDTGILIEDYCSNITITDLSLSYYANDGIYTYNPGAGLKIEHNIIANIGGPCSVIFHGNGVFIHSILSNDTLTIINNETFNIWNIGFFLTTGPALSTLYGSRICNNTLILTGGSAIGVRYAIGVEISDNYIHKASVYIPDRCGIGIENCDYMIVNHNIISEAVDDGSSPYSGWLSAGIYTFGANHSKFYYNIVSEGMVGIHLDDDGGTFGYSSVGNEIFYNLCYDFMGIGIMVEQENDSTLVYNNTTFNCLYAGISFRGYAAGNSDYCSVKNNIVCNQLYSNNVIEIADIGIGFQMDYNCFYHFAPSANLVHWLGNNYTAAEFGYYQDFSGQDIHSITDNPFFFNIDTADFSLCADSPCIDAGTYLGLGQDITGYPVPYGYAADIGAYEFHDPVTHIRTLQNQEAFKVQVYPNPFSSETIVITNKNVKDAILVMYDSAGRQVKQMKNIHGQSISLQRDNLPSGLYFIRLTVENKVYTIDKVILVDN